MRGLYRLSICFVLLSVGTGCGESDHDNQAPVGSHHHPARTGGSAVALSYDERVAVAANRTAGVISVFTLTPGKDGPPTVALKQEFDTGPGSEPWSAVIGADDDTAYVVLRKEHKVVRIRSLHGEPSMADDEAVSVGAEPTSIAIAPSGRTLFVANWGEGTINYISTSSFELNKGNADLNRVLAASQLLGDIASRPGLAHPYALAITDSGDENDSDEKLYATEFFSQPVPDADQAADAIDTNRQGIVYTISLATGNPGEWIPIGAVPDTGFMDGKGDQTGCFPNQLYAAAVDRGRLYVTSMCASPRGPLGLTTDAAGDVTSTDNFKTLVHPAVFVIDVAHDLELPDQGRLLTRTLEDLYASDGDEVARMPLIPNDIAFKSQPGPEGISSAYVSSLGADAVFRLDYDKLGSLASIGVPRRRYISLKSASALPIGVVVSQRSSAAFALTLNDGDQQLAVIDLATEALSAVDCTGKSSRAHGLLGSAELAGRHHFATGLDVWSFKGQARSSCESCHPGGLSDGVTWSFSRGPRRTLSTASTYEKTHAPDDRQRRLLLWGANSDEVHDVEGIARGVSGGVGGILSQYANFGQADNDCRLIYDNTNPAPVGKGPCSAGTESFKVKYTPDLRNVLNGSLAETTQGTACSRDAVACATSASSDWDDIDAFIRSLRAPTGPVTLSAQAIEAGHQLFVDGKCASCHGGAGWTVSKQFYEPGAAANGSLPHAMPTTLPTTLGWLRDDTYSVPSGLAALNPPAAAGPAPFRPGPAADLAAPDVIQFLYSSSGDDQIQCALRAVGTYPADGQQGKTVPGAPQVVEIRAGSGGPAQGKNGMNVPSLLGVAVGAPYFHAGNARTLEELFNPAFSGHHQALAPDFLDPLQDPLGRSDKVAFLIAYLLSIDESTSIEAIPSGMDWCNH